MRLYPLILVLLIACTQPSVIFENDKAVIVEVPKLQDKILKGLSSRTSLEDGHGMLYIFPGEKSRDFWMKNMLFPLDLIYISEDLEINNIISAEPCKEEPCTIFSSPAKYVLEVNKGFARDNDVKIGQKVRLKL